MDLSSLPGYPKPETAVPPTPPRPVGRARRMLLQALFLLVFWPGVYIIHERTPFIVAAEEKAHEREEIAEQKARKRREAEAEREAAIKRIMGRWVGEHGDGRIIRFEKDRFDLRDRHLNASGSWHYENGTYLLRESNLFGDWRARIIGAELVIEQFHSEKKSWVIFWRFRRP